MASYTPGFLRGRVTYSTNFLKDIRKRAKTDYHNFTLPVPTRSWIIALCVCKCHASRPYRRSRAGSTLFQKIHLHIMHRERMHNSQPGIVSSNLCNIKCTNWGLDSSKANFLNLAQVNARSICITIESFHQHIIEQEVNICAIMDTWLRNEDDLATRQIQPEGYKVLSYPRQGRTGGGIALVHHNHINIMDLETNHPTLTTMETHCFPINIAASQIFLQIIYQFPNTGKIDFGNELADHFESHASNLTDKMLLVGDFNIHVDNPDTILLNNLLASYNLVNRINFPTHKLQHTLDLIIDNGDNLLIMSTSRGLLISDHNFVHCTLNVKHPLPSPKTIQYRQIKKMDHTAFRDNLKNT